jgi:hypothetical protein
VKFPTLQSTQTFYFLLTNLYKSHKEVKHMARLGNGYLGTDSVKVSVANAELLPNPPANFSLGKKYNLYKFAFMNDTDCSVLINGNTNAIFLRAGQGFETNEIDSPIHSFKIVESGISYNWLGAF